MKRLYLNGRGQGKACLPLPCVEEGAKSQESGAAPKVRIPARIATRGYHGPLCELRSYEKLNDTD